LTGSIPFSLDDEREVFVHYPYTSIGLPRHGLSIDGRTLCRSEVADAFEWMEVGFVGTINMQPSNPDILELAKNDR
jgi:hypothetical protein